MKQRKEKERKGREGEKTQKKGKKKQLILTLFELGLEPNIY